MARDSDSEQRLSSDEEWLESWTPATLSRSHTERTASQNGKAGGNEQSDLGSAATVLVDDLRLDDFSLAQASFQSLDDSLEVGRRETEAASCTCGRDEASESSKQNTAEEVVRVEGSLLRCHSQRSSSLPSIPSMLTALYEKIQNETQSIRMQEDSASCPPSTPIRPNKRYSIASVSYSVLCSEKKFRESTPLYGNL
ncbi:hypothetical protein WA577_003000 [Blastocystis sp. JDR]